MEYFQIYNNQNFQPQSEFGISKPDKKGNTCFLQENNNKMTEEKLIKYGILNNRTIAREELDKDSENIAQKFIDNSLLFIVQQQFEYYQFLTIFNEIQGVFENDDNNTENPTRRIINKNIEMLVRENDRLIKKFEQYNLLDS